MTDVPVEFPVAPAPTGNAERADEVLVEAWRQILDDATEQGWELDAVWPRQEIQRLLGLLERHKDHNE